MMQRTMLVATVVVLVVASGIGAAAAGVGADVAQEEEVTIELSATTPAGDAIDGANVTVEWDGGSVQTQTFSNGRAFADVPRGADLEITLEHETYVKNVPVTVDGATGEQVVETTMYEPATAAVAVVDSEDEPVEGATVRLRKQGQGPFADRGDTNGEGTFTSGEVEEGTYTVLVREPGYYDAEQTVELRGETNTTVQIEQGEITVDLLVQDPTPEGNGTLSADASVTLDGQQEISVRTNEQGPRSILLDVNRDYEVTISRDGYSTRSVDLRTGESNIQRTFNITRTPSITLTAGNEQVVVGENLRVEVTDEYDRPVEGATILVGGDTVGETDADGVARVPIDSEGEVQVSAEYEGLSADPATVTGVPGSTDDGEDEGDGGTGDGSPGFGVVAALLGALAAVAALARRR